MTDAREIGRDKSKLGTLIYEAIAFPGEVCGTALMDESLHDWQTRAVRTMLEAAGFRIIGPDEVDQVTVEKCAEVAENCPDTPFAESRRWHGNLRQSIPAAIRAIGRKA